MKKELSKSEKLFFSVNFRLPDEIARFSLKSIFTVKMFHEDWFKLKMGHLTLICRVDYTRTFFLRLFLHEKRVW